MANEGGFSGGLILGALVGVAAALLLTPRTGKENREWLAKQLNENTDLKNVIDQGKHSGEELISHTRKAIQENLDHLHDLVEGGKQKLKKFNSDKKETAKGTSEL
jgi:gas vesicle protein